MASEPSIEILELIDEIGSWLQTNPSPLDIQAYLQHFPEDNVSIITQTVNAQRLRLVRQKNDYVTAHNLEALLKLTEFEQLDVLEFLSIGAQSSISENFPQLSVTTWSEEAIAWSQAYILDWKTLLRFASGVEFLQQRTLAELLLATKPEKEAVVLYVTQLAETYKEEARLFEQNSPLKIEFYNKESALLEKIAIFPKPFLVDILQPDHNQERFQLLYRLFIIFSAARELGDDYLNQEILLESIWLHQMDQAESSLLVVTEAERLASQSIYDPRIRHGLEIMLTPAAIQSGQALVQLRTYIESLSLKQRETLATYLYPFLKNSFILNFEIEPLEMLEVIQVLGASETEEDGKKKIDLLINEIVDLPEEKQPQLRALLECINYLVHVLPIAQYV